MAQSDAWRSWERKLCSTLQRIVGPVKEIGLRNIVTETGRVGHLTSLGMDGIVGDHKEGVALVIEAKRRKMPKWFLEDVAQISEISGAYERQPLIGFSLASDFGRQQSVKDAAGKVKKDRSGRAIPLHKEWAAVPLDYMAELLAARRMVAELVVGDVQLTNKFLRYLEGTTFTKEDE